MKTTRPIIITFLLFIIVPISLISADPYFYKATTKSGDGIYSLLRRYHLDTDACNIELFREINGLSKKQTLAANKEYQLPIKIYSYNGTSIRSSIGVDDWEKAVSIKDYNDLIFKNKVRQTRYTDSKILWVPLAFIECKYSNKNTDQIASTPSKADKAQPTKSSTSSYRQEPLFGKKHENVTVIDKKLKNKVYYLVSGHGGPDPGAQCTECPNTLCEDEYAYDVILRLARNLMQHGAIVHIIIKDKNDGIREGEHLKCDTDEVCMDNLKLPAKQQKRLVQRAAAINSLAKIHKRKGHTDQTAVMIHVDSNIKTSQRIDTYFMYGKGSKKGKKMAHNIQKTFKKKYDKYQKGRGYKGHVSQRGWYMLNYTSPPAVYIELGNIKNKEDQKRITFDSNRQLLANWIFEGLTDIPKR